MRAPQNVDNRIVGPAEKAWPVTVRRIGGVEVETKNAGNVRLKRGEGAYVN